MGTGSTNNSKALIGRKAICTYLDNISIPQFYKFVQWGMPAIVQDGRWYSHTENIDNWFQKITFAHMEDIPKDAK